MSYCPPQWDGGAAGECPCPASRDARCQHAALQAGGDGVLQVGTGRLLCWGPPSPGTRDGCHLSVRGAGAWPWLRAGLVGGSSDDSPWLPTPLLFLPHRHRVPLPCPAEGLWGWSTAARGHQLLVPVTAAGGIWGGCPRGPQPSLAAVKAWGTSLSRWWGRSRAASQPCCCEQHAEPPGCPSVGPPALLAAPRGAAPAAKCCHFLPLGFCRGGREGGGAFLEPCLHFWSFLRETFSRRPPPPQQPAGLQLFQNTVPLSSPCWAAPGAKSVCWGGEQPSASSTSVSVPNLCPTSCPPPTILTHCPGPRST